MRKDTSQKLQRNYPKRKLAAKAKPKSKIVVSKKRTRHTGLGEDDVIEDQEVLYRLNTDTGLQKCEDPEVDITVPQATGIWDEGDEQKPKLVINEYDYRLCHVCHTHEATQEVPDNVSLGHRCGSHMCQNWVHVECKKADLTVKQRHLEWGLYRRYSTTPFDDLNRRQPIGNEETTSLSFPKGHKELMFTLCEIRKMLDGVSRKNKILDPPPGVNFEEPIADTDVLELLSANHHDEVNGAYNLERIPNPKPMMIFDSLDSSRKNRKKRDKLIRCLERYQGDISIGEAFIRQNKSKLLHRHAFQGDSVLSDRSDKVEATKVHASSSGTNFYSLAGRSLNADEAPQIHIVYKKYNHVDMYNQHRVSRIGTKVRLTRPFTSSLRRETTGKKRKKKIIYLRVPKRNPNLASDNEMGSPLVLPKVHIGSEELTNTAQPAADVGRGARNRGAGTMADYNRLKREMHEKREKDKNMPQKMSSKKLPHVKINIGTRTGVSESFELSETTQGLPDGRLMLKHFGRNVVQLYQNMTRDHQLYLSNGAKDTNGVLSLAAFVKCLLATPRSTSPPITYSGDDRDLEQITLMIRQRFHFLRIIFTQLAEKQHPWHIRAEHGLYKYFPEAISEARLHMHESMVTYSVPRIKELNVPLPMTKWEKKQMDIYHEGLEMAGDPERIRSEKEQLFYEKGFEALTKTQIQRRARKEADYVLQGNCNSCRVIAETMVLTNTCYYCRFTLSEEANRCSRAIKEAMGPINKRRSLLCGVNAPTARMMECSGKGCDNMAHLACMFTSDELLVRGPSTLDGAPRIYDRSHSNYWTILNSEGPMDMLSIYPHRAHLRKHVDLCDYELNDEEIAQRNMDELYRPHNDWTALLDHWKCPVCEQKENFHVLEPGATLPSLGMFSDLFREAGSHQECEGECWEDPVDIKFLLQNGLSIDIPNPQYSAHDTTVRIMAQLLHQSSSQIRHISPLPNAPVKSYYAPEGCYGWVVDKMNWLWVAVELVPSIAYHMSMLSLPGIVEDPNLSILFGTRSPLMLTRDCSKQGTLSYKDIEQDLFDKNDENEFVENYIYRNLEINRRWVKHPIRRNIKKLPKKKNKANTKESLKYQPIMLTDGQVDYLRDIPSDLRCSVYDTLSTKMSHETIVADDGVLYKNAAVQVGVHMLPNVPINKDGTQRCIICPCDAICRSYRLMPGLSKHKNHQAERCKNLIKYLRQEDGLNSESSEDDLPERKTRGRPTKRSAQPRQKNYRYTKESVEQKFEFDGKEQPLLEAQNGWTSEDNYCIKNRFGFSMTKLFGIYWRLYDAIETFFIGGRSTLLQQSRIAHVHEGIGQRDIGGTIVFLPLYPRWTGLGGSHAQGHVMPVLRHPIPGDGFSGSIKEYQSSLIQAATHLDLHELLKMMSLGNLRRRIRVQVDAVRSLLAPHYECYRTAPLPLGFDFVPATWAEWEVVNEVVCLCGHRPLFGCAHDVEVDDGALASKSVLDYMSRLNQAVARQWDSVTSMQLVVAARKSVFTSGDLLAFGMPSLATGSYEETGEDFYPMASGFPSDMIRFYMYRAIETCGILPGVVADWNNQKGVIVNTNELIQENTLIGDYSGLKLPLLYSNQNWMSNALMAEHEPSAHETFWMSKNVTKPGAADRHKYTDSAVSIDGQFCGNHLSLMSGISTREASAVFRRNVTLIWADMKKPLVASQVDEEGERLSNWILHSHGQLSEDHRHILANIPFLHFNDEKDFISSVENPLLIQLPRYLNAGSEERLDLQELFHLLLCDQEYWNNWWLFSCFFMGRWLTDKRNEKLTGKEFSLGSDNPVIKALAYRVSSYPKCLIKDIVILSEALIGVGWQMTLKSIERDATTFKLPCLSGTRPDGRSYLERWIVRHRASPLAIMLEMFNLLIMDRDLKRLVAHHQLHGVGRRDGADLRGIHLAMQKHVARGGSSLINDFSDVDAIMNWPIRSNMRDFYETRERLASRQKSMLKTGLVWNPVATYQRDHSAHVNAAVYRTQEGVRWIMQRDGRLLAVANQNLQAGVELYIKYGGDFDTGGYE